jgi:hypothetical protein
LVTHNIPDKFIPYILKDPKAAVNYARQLNKRIPEAEKIIRQDVPSAYAYADGIIKGRWPEAEDIIKKDNFYNVSYARNVIKNKWPEAEPFIVTDKSVKNFYNKFLKSIGLDPI